MRLAYLVVLLPMALGGCLSISSTPAPRQTVVVPPGTTAFIPQNATVVCSNGLLPPC